MTISALVFVALLVLMPEPGSAFVAESQTNLTADLLDKLGQKNGDRNVLVSPSSIFYGLSMLYWGMDGQTKESVAQALGFPSEDDQEFKEAMEMFTAKEEGSPLFLGNFISLRKGLVKKGGGKSSSYAKDIKDVFHADIYQQDFSDPEKQRRNINKWVWRRTNKKIRELMPQGSVSTDTALVLVNALYFKSEFETPFDADDVPAPFQTSSGDQVQVETMTSDDMTVGLYEDSDVTLVSLPFKAPGFHLVLAMPNDQEGSTPVDILTDEVMSKVMHPELLESAQIGLKVPKFNVTMGNELTGLLSSLPGLSPAFGSGADYSKITSQPVKVQQVNHKATFEMNKNGVEASAATSISVTLYSLFTPDKTLSFDRPFAYFIVQDGKAVHMAGILNNPKDSQ